MLCDRIVRELMLSVSFKTALNKASFIFIWRGLLNLLLHKHDLPGLLYLVYSCRYFNKARYVGNLECSYRYT